MSRGEVFEGEIITMPAPPISGAAVTAAAEHVVPTTPTMALSVATARPAASPPSGEQPSSTGVPSSTSNPWICP